MNIQRELGLPVSPHRYSDDADVIETHLLRSLDRFGDRLYSRNAENGIWQRDSRIITPSQAAMQDRCLSTYEAELLILDKRIASRAYQSR